MVKSRFYFVNACDFRPICALKISQTLDNLLFGAVQHAIFANHSDQYQNEQLRARHCNGKRNAHMKIVFFVVACSVFPLYDIYVWFFLAINADGCKMCITHNKKRNAVE